MTDKVQLIKEEIERQIEKGKVKCQQSQENNDHESLVAWSEHVATCGKLLVFIDSIPEEPKCIYNKTLDERKKFCKYCSAACGVRVEEEPASESLEEELHSWMRENCDDNGFFNQLELARHFAEWQKQQMMKYALDGCVSQIVKEDTSSRNLFISTQQLYKELQKYENGDKMKIIIVKDDQQ